MPDGSLPQPLGALPYAVFRATRIASDHPALVGRTLTPLNPQPEIQEPPSPEEAETSETDEDTEDSHDDADEDTDDGAHGDAHEDTDEVDGP